MDSLESSFNVQEYLQQLIRKDGSQVYEIVELPDNVDKEVWQYEHLRYLNKRKEGDYVLTAYHRQVCLELSLLVVALESECTRENCPEMKADGWLYLCAAHPSTQSVKCVRVSCH